MKKFQIKEFDIDKDQRRTLLIVTVATVITVFGLVSTKALLGQAAYHRHVLSAKRQSINQLKFNIDSLNTLKTQYETFNSANPNAIDGNNNPNLQNPVPPDGSNSRIVLDALPTTYDFPALISSVSKLVSIDHITNPGISGSDESASVDSKPQANPSPSTITVSISGLTSYSGADNLILDLERSVRPFDVAKLQLNGTSTDMTISISATTYFQPAKILSNGTKEVK